MATTTKTDEIEKLKAELMKAASGIAANHYIWMIDAARNDFEEKVVGIENQILRAKHFRPDAKADYDQGKTKIQELETHLERYESLLKFLKALKNYINRAHTDVSAKELAAFLKSRHKL